nr:MAG TPA: hypothetical protein [Caudoviricetes sp.]DAU83706.1 MAG TPA: hypothetical protein [Caudoviricetes sp.]
MMLFCVVLAKILNLYPVFSVRVITERKTFLKRLINIGI